MFCCCLPSRKRSRINMPKFMRVMVFFDLPVTSERERRVATQFRNFLIKDGYYMLQYSVYVRLCGGQDSVDDALNRLKYAAPHTGSIRRHGETIQPYETHSRRKEKTGKTHRDISNKLPVGQFFEILKAPTSRKKRKRATVWLSSPFALRLVPFLPIIPYQNLKGN